MSRHRWNRCLFVAAGLACLGSAPGLTGRIVAEEIPARPTAVTSTLPKPEGTPATTDAPVTALLGSRFPGGEWVYFSGKKDARIEETWSIDRSTQEPILICRGEPHGYLRTSAVYADFQLGLEWKYPTDENGNSGILLFTNGEDKLWPTAVQVQLHKPRTGSILASGRAEVKPPLVTKNHFSRPVNQWNELLLTCRSGTVSLKINGKDVGEVSVAMPRTGSIALQSEGSEVHFRKIWIRDLRGSIQAKAKWNAARPLCPEVLCDLSALSEFSSGNRRAATYHPVDAVDGLPFGLRRTGQAEKWTVVVKGPRIRRTKDVDYYVAHRVPLAADGCVCLPDDHSGDAGDSTVVPSRRDERRSDRLARRSDAAD